MHIVLGCVHAPFHNAKMMDGVVKLINKYKDQLAGFHLIGDFLDLNSLSAHDVGRSPINIDGDPINLTWEYRESNKLLNKFDRVLPKQVKKYFIYGNHEDRFFRHLATIDQSKYGDELTSPTRGLKLKERGYKVYEDYKNDYYYIGKHLQIFHGYYHGVTPAKQTLDKLKVSCMFAHSHRANIHYQNDMIAFNIGWGGDKTQPVFNYAPRPMKDAWINGFGVVFTDKKGGYHGQVVTAYDGNFYFNGKEY